jgi:hypothetical protein
VPATCSINAKVKLSDSSADREALCYVISPVFRIREKFNLIHPENGTTLIAGGSTTINWTRISSSSLPIVQLYYDNGTGSYAWLYNVSNSLTEKNWDIPTDAISAQCRMKVQSPIDPDNFAESDNPFGVRGSITVTQPTNTTTVWDLNQTYPITWDYVGPVQHVKIEFSDNGGKDYNYTLNASASAGGGSSGSYSWWINGTKFPLTTSGRIRVSDAENFTTLCRDESNNNFTIQGSISLYAPNEENLTLKVGDNYGITWTVYGGISNVNLSYSNDSGGNWTYIDTVGGGSSPYPWEVPDRLGNFTKVKVYDATNPGCKNISAYNFNIIGQIIIQNITAGDVWRVADPHYINWTPYGTLGTVRIEGSSDNFSTDVFLINSSVPAGTHKQSPPVSYYYPNVQDNISSSIRIRVTDIDTPTVYGLSPVIMIKGNISVSDPDGLEPWLVGENHTIYWWANGKVGNVTLKLKYGTSEDVIVASTATGASGKDQGSYSWIIGTSGIGDVKCETCRIYVYDESDPFNTSGMSVPFAIRPKITVTSPVLNESLNMTESYPNKVNWTMNGTGTIQVKIYYSTDGGATYSHAINDSGLVQANWGTYEWNDVAGPSNYRMTKVKVVDKNYDYINGTSSLCSIMGKITLNEPDASANWTVLNASTGKVSWTTTGVDQLKIWLATNGTNFAQQGSSVNASTGSPQYINVPATCSINAKVKLSDSSADREALCYVISPVFRIREKFNLIHPENDTVLVAGTSTTINWSRVSSNSLPIVQLYFYNGSGSYAWLYNVSNTLTEKSWDIPTNVISYECRMKVQSPIDPDNYAESDNPFGIRGSITVTQPNNATTVWELNHTYPITWDYVGPVQNVKIEYSDNGGKDYNYTLKGSTSAGGGSSGSWNWFINESINLSTSARIRISDTDYFQTQSRDESNYNFTTQGSISMYTPDHQPDLILRVGQTCNITWLTHGQIANVNLSFSNNNGANWTLINTGQIPLPAGSSPYPWQVPDSISDNCLVKVWDAANSNVKNTSTNFKVIGQLAINYPFKNEEWFFGENRSINWTPTGTFGFVILQGSTDNFTTDLWNISRRPAGTSGTQTYWNYTVGDHLGTQVRIRVFDEDHPNDVVAVSGTFMIKGRLQVLVPNGTNITPWVAGTYPTIQWQRFGSIPKVNIYCWNGDLWLEVVKNLTMNSTTKSYNEWPVDDSAVFIQAKINVTDAGDESVCDESDQFKIIGSINLVTPENQGEALYANEPEPYKLNWTRRGLYSLNKAKLEYSLDGKCGTYFTINDNVDIGQPSGTCDWYVPGAVLSNNVYIKMTNKDDADVYDYSPKVRIAGKIFTDKPALNDTCTVNETCTIKWRVQGNMQNVSLKCYTPLAGTIPINDSVAAYKGNLSDGYSWMPPANKTGIITLNATITITDTGDDLTFNTTPKFSILPKIVVKTPASNENLSANRNYTITWDALGAGSSVKLNIYRSASGFGGSYPLVEANVSNSGEYNWLVPDHLNNTYQVMVTYADDERAKGESGVFRIIPEFTVIGPASGDMWPVGSTQTIAWNCSSANESWVNLTYFIAAQEIVPPINSSVNNSGPADITHYYPWGPVPDYVNTTAQLKIRVQSANSTRKFAHADSATIKIVGYFNLTEPNGGTTQNFTVGENTSITWERKGTVPYVNIYLLRFTNATNYTMLPIAIDYTANVTQTYNTYTWKVNDSISNTSSLKIRVTDAYDPHTDTLLGGGYDDSDDYFKIRGAFNISKPVQGDRAEIGNPFNITWNTTGNISRVRILAYNPEENEIIRNQSRFNFTLDRPYNITATYFNNNGNGQTIYPWTIPDNATPTARIRIYDYYDNSTFAESGNFSLVGTFNVTTPAGNESWVVGANRNITWNYTGSSIKEAKISYCLNGTSGDWIAINETWGNPDDGIVNNTRRYYSWQVPDNITAGYTVHIKIEDPLDDLTYNISKGFKIRGNFSISDPKGGERWIANSTHTLSWNTTGTIYNVSIYYSRDNFTTAPLLAANLTDRGPGANTYSWTTPDPCTVFGINSSQLPINIRIRVQDSHDYTVNATSPAFQLDYYNITWHLRDFLSNLPITIGLEVDDDSGWKELNLSSPVSHRTRYGGWNATWSHKDYGTAKESYMADEDKSITVYLESKVVHVWEAKTDYVYTPGNSTTSDRMTFRSYLVRDGSIAGTRLSNGSFYTIAKNCTLEIYNPSGTIRTTMNTSTVTSAGFFSIEWSPTGLNTNITYPTITQICTSLNGTFRTPFLINMIPTMNLYNVETRVKEYINVPLTVIQSTLVGELRNQTQLIVGNRTQQEIQEIRAGGGMVGLVEEALRTFENNTDAAIQRLEAGANDTVAAAEKAKDAASDLEATARQFSWNAVVAPNPALQGDMVTLQCQGPSGLQPRLNIYSWDEKTLVKDIFLKDDVTSGVYIYEFKVDNRFTSGKAYTYVIDESTTHGMVAGSGMVESMSMTTIAGLASAAPAAERAAKRALDAIEAIEAVLVSGDNINIALTLKNLKESVDALPDVLSKEGASPVIVKTLNQIAEKLNIFGGEEGLDFSTLLEEALGESPTIKDIRTKTEAIQGIIQLLQMLFEAKFGGLDTPIVSTSLHSGSVIFRITTVNPSKSKTQKVPVKIYLPEEVKPKDVIDIGGLELDYDAEKRVYYLFKGDLTLSPGELRMFQVEVEDVWIVAETRLQELKTRIDNILVRLEKTDYYPRAKEISDSIYERLESIRKSQSDETIGQQQHIGVYRDNMQIIEKINEDIAKLEKALATAGGPLAPEILAKTKIKSESPTKTMTWIIIFIIIIFIGLMAAVLFFTWQRQARITKEALQSAKNTAFPDYPEEKAPTEENQK